MILACACSARPLPEFGNGPGPAPRANTVGQRAAWVEVKGIARDGDGALVIAGSSTKSIYGEAFVGRENGLLIKYAPNGTRVWTRLLGGAAATLMVTSVVIDASGAIYAAGAVKGAVAGTVATGDRDLIVVKFSSNGNLLWARRLGEIGASFDGAYLALSAAGVWVAGDVRGAFDGNAPVGVQDLSLTHFDASGTKDHGVRYGGGGVTMRVAGISYAANRLTVAASVDGSVGGEAYSGGELDGAMLAFDENGAPLGARLFGVNGAYTEVAGIASDEAGNAYLAGYTTGALNGETGLGGASDAFLLSFDASATLRWTRLFGTTTSARHVFAQGLATAGGRVFVAASAMGPVGGLEGPGAVSALLTAYSDQGNFLYANALSDADSYGIAQAVTAGAGGEAIFAGQFGGQGFTGAPTEGLADGFWLRLGVAGNLL